jgi:hypothetical protein
MQAFCDMLIPIYAARVARSCESVLVIRLPGGAICPGEGPNGGPCEPVYTLPYNTAGGGLADLNGIVTPHGASIALRYSLDGSAGSVLSWYDCLYDSVTEWQAVRSESFRKQGAIGLPTGNRRLHDCVGATASRPGRNSRV